MAIAHQVSAIRKSAEAIDAAATDTIGAASVGDVVRQGDLYLVCLEHCPEGTPTKTRQLAPGTTQGSRHVAGGKCRVIDADRRIVAKLLTQAVSVEVPPELIGPVVDATIDTEITHPEHGNRILPAGSVWAVVYQRAYADEVRRVCD